MTDAVYAAVDGGTTNTRIVLARGETLFARVKIPCGAGDTARNGSAARWAREVRQGLEELLLQNGIAPTELHGIFASGMICSELGLHATAHLPCPAGEAELAAAAETVRMSEISDVPVTFIPGLKCGGEKTEDTDIMRGEETEAVGIRRLCGNAADRPYVLLLPGTHNKAVFVDGEGRITRFYTAMSGELVRCVAEHTILKEALDGGFSKTPDQAFLLQGYDLCETHGFTAALFKLRISAIFFEKEPRRLYSMLLGMALHEDIRLLTGAHGAKDVRIAGSEPFKSALAVLLGQRTALCFECVPEKIADESAAVGALAIGRKAPCAADVKKTIDSL